jgi:hypothetical protein
MGSEMVDFLRSYVVLRQREGAFRKGDPDALVMLLAAPAMQCASSKYIFGIKAVPRPDKDIAGEFAKLLVAALRPSGFRPTTKGSKKTSKRNAG